MAGEYLVIGLGQFGFAVARELAERGAEVVAIDKDEGPVNRIAPFVTRALIMDATDEDSIVALDPSGMDAVVCGVGEDSADASILVTTLLKEHGARHLVTREIGSLHARVLRKVGADVLVNPEAELARNVAQRLLLPSMDYLYDLGDGLVMAEIPSPSPFLGKRVSELELQERFRVTLVGIRPEPEGAKLHKPLPNQEITENSHLLVVGTDSDLSFLARGSS